MLMGQKKCKIAVLVSGSGTNLKAILDAIDTGTVRNGEVTIVISSRPGVFALERAQKRGIHTAIVERKAYFDAIDFDAALLDELRKAQVDFIVLAGFLSILGKSIISAYPNRIINVHPALVPAFSGEGFYGLRVHAAALARGVKLTGATVHFVNEIADGGPIIAQKSVAVEEDDTPETLQRRVMEQAEWILLPQAIDWLCRGRLEVRDNRVIIREETA